jgi:hypothetical protein
LNLQSLILEGWSGWAKQVMWIHIQGKYSISHWIDVYWQFFISIGWGRDLHRRSIPKV